MQRNLLCAVAVCVLALSARAADQVVTAVGDNGGPNQLRAKLAALQSSGGGKLTFNVGTATILLALGPLPAITAASTIDGGGTVTVDGAGTSSIFSVSSGTSLTLENLTLANGFNGSADGGAVVNAGTLVVDQCTFTNNQAGVSFNGGAISSTGSLTVTSSEFASNKAGNGGAVYANSAGAPTQLTDCNFHDNATINAISGWGGAILAWDGSPVVIASASFTSNTARFGGAIYIRPSAAVDGTDTVFGENKAIVGGGSIFMDDGGAASFGNTQFVANSVSGYIGAVSGSGGGAVSSKGTLALTDCGLSANAAGSYGGGAVIVGGGVFSIQSSVFDGNTATNGGGIETDNQASISVTECTISGNSATGNLGGGINNSAGSLATITASTISGNSAAGSGGGIADASVLSLTNSTVSGNTAASKGGGIYLSGAPSGNLLNVTLADNSAPTAGGIYHPGGAGAGNFTLQNTIIAQNSGANLVRGGTGGGTFVSNGYNLSDDDSGSAFLIGPGDKSGTGFDAKLGPLADNGGSTLTQLPGPGSDAIDAGTSVGAPSIDQRGDSRPQGAAVDMGALEVAPGESSTFANISTRLQVETGDNVLIGGFIVSGTGPKQVLIRAIGPSLPLSGTLADPILELHDANGILETNDNWVDSPNKQEIVDTMLAPASDSESAIIRTLPAGGAAYTAIVRGADNGTGIALVEVYEIEQSVNCRLANISTRGLVGTGDNVMIGGFIINGGNGQTVLLRAIGPSLPLAGTLSDPLLEFHDAEGNVVTNDNWRDAQETEITATGLAPASDAEAAILQTLTPGAYTAIVRGADGGSGVALIEAYDLD